MIDERNHLLNISKIERRYENNNRLSHASNILVKENDRINGRLKRDQSDGLEEIVAQYVKYIGVMFQNKGFTEDIIRKRVELLNEYYNFIHFNGYDNVFTSQGKFRSTILEEFMYILFADYVEHLKNVHRDVNDVIHCGSAKAYTNLYFSAPRFRDFVASPSIEINVKDQDFAIYRDIRIVVEGEEKLAKLPVAAIENKTYLDKTMLDSVIATAEKVKQGFPYARFVVVAENYDVSLDVDPVYSRIDQIYVLRKCKRKEQWQDIDADIVVRMFNETKKHIERPWSDIASKMRNEGVIL